ncbi:MAG TPA: hypothetical protein VGP52_09655 [Stellaceae bacterium]|nr:hypothetical protein [Stellaceae bacterium]
MRPYPKQHPAATGPVRKLSSPLLRAACLMLALAVSGVLATIACPRPAGAAGYAFDVDGSGAPDANLQLSHCQKKPSAVCLQLKSAKFGAKEFFLTDNTKATPIHIGLIGRQFADGPLAAAFVYWLTGADAIGATGPLVALSVFDLNGAGQKAWVAPPKANRAQHFQGYSVYDTYFAVLAGPGGKRYPFLAPGQRYLNLAHWDFLCLFDPANIAKPDPACGTGFRRVSATFPNAAKLSGFRHNGGWLEDVDGDGWQDINLPFLRYILVISGHTGAQLALLHPQIAEHARHGAPVDFDSGRFYGSFTPFAAASSKHDVLIASANPVGTFNDIYCNVARYYAVLETKAPDAPQTRDLKWANYISFVKNYFSDADARNMVRRGDGIDHCVHRVSDSVFHAQTKTFTLYNEFTTDPPLAQNTCLTQQKAEWRAHFQPDKMKAWTACADQKFAPATGDWQVQLRDLADGHRLARWPNGYVWGRLENFVPGYPETFLLEAMAERVPFDQKGYSPKALSIVAVNPDFTLRQLGALPVAVRPRILAPAPDPLPYQGTVGSTWRGILEVASRPDADGLNDIELQDGRWVGYSPQTKGFVLKP